MRRLLLSSGCSCASVLLRTPDHLILRLLQMLDSNVNVEASAQPKTTTHASELRILGDCLVDILWALQALVGSKQLLRAGSHTRSFRSRLLAIGPATTKAEFAAHLHGRAK